MKRSLSLLAIGSSFLITAPAIASVPSEWTRSVAPFHIMGPVWYVGTEGVAAYVIQTSSGAILIDGTLAENAGLLQQNLVSIGVKLRSVRYILVSHAHFDHVGGDAALKAATGARVVAGVGDRDALESGQGPGEYASGEPVAGFPPVTVDRAVNDGDRLTLGRVTLTAHLTPGHTPGCTTWTMRVVDHGKAHNIAFLCSLTVAGNRLVGNRRYPDIVHDYRTSFQRAARLKADVILPSHPDIAQVLDREKRAAAGDTGAFVAPGLLTQLVADAQANFDEELARQTAAANHAS